ncbi:DUF1178 family protein [Methylocystis heyeri]|uniref:DUF1178 family protein n=1 Tax=Methylocystis heyeri TaxID=391905 RepID=A0A6B8KDQ4_9HYPH|nr:DUF1178 family protein [Methylocystis heyeri]QGM45807.1 DUF1178 family protein [Methylocystis heyeri]
MIHYSLICDKGHEFDGWFRDSAAFDAQEAAGSVHCPFCQSSKIAKAPMAPNILRGAGARQVQSGEDERQAEAAREVALLDERDAQLRGAIRELREKIVSATEDVGERFPSEVRKIQDGEASARAIRGKATFAEAKALLDEGIEIMALPASFSGEGN